MKTKFILLTLLCISFITKAQNWGIVPVTTTDDLADVAYGSATHVYIVGGSSILKSTNGGTTFTSLNTSFLTTGSVLYACFFTSQDTGFVAGSDGLGIGFIYKTTNGGTSWTSVLSSVPSSVNSIHFPSSQIGYAISGNLGVGNIFKTTNGGNTWTPIYTSPTGTDDYLSKVHFINNNDGYVVGLNSTAATFESKQIKVSGGSTTSATTNSSYFLFTDVYFKSIDTGYVVALDFNGSYILKTTNGGNSWTPVYTNLMDDPNALTFASPSKGFAVGTGGLIIKTTNGGTTWAPVTSPTTENLIEVSFHDSSSGIIVGGLGTVLKTIVCTGSPTTGTLVVPPACGPVSVNGQFYSVSGTYTQLLINTAGCDSTLTIQVTINNPSNTQLFANSCGPYVLNGITYSSTGTYTQNYINSQGCDSIVTLDLTVNSPTSSNTTVNTCGSYNWNSLTYTVSGTYTKTLINASGCDSIATLNLILTPLNVILNQNGLVLTANPAGASYQWLNCPSMTPIAGATNQTYNVTANGNYAVKVVQGSCLDTSTCKAVTGVGITDYDVQNRISLYPNPTEGKFIVKLNEDVTNAGLKVLNLTGQTIWSQSHINGNQFEIDLAFASNGIYLLEIETANHKTSRVKFYKE